MRRAAPIAVLTLAALARVVLIAASWSSAPADPDNYLPLARSLAAGEGFRFNGRLTAYRPPLYPLVLVPVAAAGNSGLRPLLALLHVGLGVLATHLTLRTARCWGFSHPRALAAGLVVALDPVLVAQAASVMTETLAAALVAASLRALAGTPAARASLAAGALLGLSSLCRPSLLPAAALCILARLASGPECPRYRLRSAILISAVLFATMLPWALRNARLFGETVWTTTHGGYTLALANNPAYYEDVLHDAAGAVWTGPNQQAWFERITRQTAGLTEPQADRFLRDQALSLLRTRPNDFLRASLARLGRFWALSPSAEVYSRPIRLVTALWTLPLWVALGLGLTRKQTWSWPRLAAVAFLLGLTAVHALYWTDLRMRAPLVPAVALLAASASVPSLRALRGRR